MYAVIILSSMLVGWAIRRKSAEILKIRKTNQARRSRRRKAARNEKCWRQILEVRV